MDSPVCEEADCITYGIGKLHPLLVPSVVNEIASYLKFSDLRSFRLVCTLWKDEGIKYFRKKSMIVFNSTKRLTEFTTMMPKDGPFYFNAFQFGPGVSLCYSSYPGTCHPSVEIFFNDFGSRVKSLFLNYSKWYGVDLVDMLYTKLENLEELALVAEVQGKLFTTEEYQGKSLKNVKCLRLNLRWTRIIRNTEMMKDLLEIFPNLEVISWIKAVGDDNRYDRNFQLDLELAFAAAAHPNSSTIRDTVYDMAIHCKDLPSFHLKRVECNMRLNNESVMSLTSKNFPLQYLDLTLTPDVKTTVLQQLLVQIANTLCHLKLEFHPSEGAECTQDFNFPCMKLVKHLFLFRYEGSILIVQQFPKLCSLTLQESAFVKMLEKDQDYDLGDVEPQLTLKTLQTVNDLENSSLSETNAIYLSKIFPSLRRLGLEIREKETKLTKDICFSRFKYLTEIGQPSEVGIGEFSLPKTERECPEYSKGTLTRLNKLLY